MLSRKELGDEQLARTVAARLDRQSVLYDRTKTLRFVVTEPVLRWLLVPPPVMAGQLDRLIFLSGLPNLDIRVVPLTAAQKYAPGHSFVIRDNRTVTVETLHAEMAVTDPRDVALYVKKFEHFSSGALADDAMRDFLTAVRDEFLREQETPWTPHSASQDSGHDSE